VSDAVLQLLASVPMRTGRGGNDREHPMARHRRVKAEKKNVGWMLAVRVKPKTPCVIILTRVAPSEGLDDDNLVGALKGTRDAVADWLGVDDKHKHIVRYRYEQRRGPWAVEIAVEAP
jgi:hypothetical protein